MISGVNSVEGLRACIIKIATAFVVHFMIIHIDTNFMTGSLYQVWFVFRGNRFLLWSDCKVVGWVTLGDTIFSFLPLQLLYSFNLHQLLPLFFLCPLLFIILSNFNFLIFYFSLPFFLVQLFNQTASTAQVVLFIRWVIVRLWINSGTLHRLVKRDGN